MGASSFTADFEDILARSLATPDTPCTAITKATEAATPHVGIKLRQRHQRPDLQREPAVERRGQPEARGQPAGGEVRHDPGHFVEQEQPGQLDRREAEAC